MIKKISTLAICDFVLALIIYARVNLKNALLSEITTNTTYKYNWTVKYYRKK